MAYPYGEPPERPSLVQTQVASGFATNIRFRPALVTQLHILTKLARLSMRLNPNTNRNIFP